MNIFFLVAVKANCNVSIKPISTHTSLQKICGGFLLLFLSACSSVSLSSDSKPGTAMMAKYNTDEAGSSSIHALSELPTDITSSPPVPLVKNLWQIVTDNINLLPAKNQTQAWQRIHREQALLERQHDYLNIISQRANQYFYHIINMAQKRQIPIELALLPAIESGYDAFAFSQGHAAGLWQFIPSTARAYGLKINWWYDGRRDIIAASNAAMNYLQTLSKRFDGDWLLAMAAYNAGGGTVNKALKKNRQEAKPENFWSLDLPGETQRYVPRLLALANLLKQASASNSLPFIANKPTFKQCNTHGQLDLTLAAELANTDLNTIKQFNPAYNRWTTAPNGPNYLLIKLGNAQAFEEGIAALPKEKRLNWVRYKVQKGDTISSIAQKYHTNIKTIMSINQLNDSQIRVHQVLLLAKGTKNLHKTQYQKQIKTILKHRPAGSRYKVYHQVKSGDSFWSIAKAYQVNHLAIARWNKRSAGKALRPGEKLLIWKKHKGPKGEVRRISYTVRKGDSLALIAKRFRVRTVDIALWNGLNKKRYLKPGQNLRLYIDVKNRL